MLELKNVSVSYGPIEALKDATLDVKQGEIVALIGANGAGKSTTLLAISGVARARAGELLFNGESITSRPVHELVSLGISHVPEGRRIFPRLTVLENLEIGAYGKSSQETKDGIESAVALFPALSPRMRQLGGTLSGGEQQMLAIGRALMAKPRLLLLDEPSLGLAPIIVSKIFRIIRDINQQGTTILLVEQNAKAALNLANRAFVLETGRIVKHGNAAELANDPDVRKAYLGE
jgi:branched-chain amino acid transport system ATP-binding protein